MLKLITSYLDPKAPVPELTNHFSSVLVLHKSSKTIHSDDTFGFWENPGWFMRWIVGVRPKKLDVHTTLKSVGLNRTKEAPLQFKCWMEKLVKDWDFDSIATAHNGNMVRSTREVGEEEMT